MLATALEITYSLAQLEALNASIGPTGTAKFQLVSLRPSLPPGAKRRQAPSAKRLPNR